MDLVTLSEVKLWLRVDENEEDLLIQTMIDAADEYLSHATGRRWTAETPTAKLCAMALIADWYENRELVGEGSSDKVRPAIQSMIAQLSYTPPNESGDDDDP